jgi:zinc transport system substrate-binding protein
MRIKLYLFGALLSWASLSWGLEPLVITVSIEPQKFFVTRIGGAQVRVNVLVPPGRSPASYEPTPQQMAALSASPLIFRIGVPFENAWLPRLAELAPNARLIDMRKGLTLRPIDLPPGSAIQSEGAPDPHIWLSPPLVMRMADQIRDTLIAERPEAAAEFQRHHATFVAELKALDADIRGRLAEKKGRNFMVYHPSWGYFADAYGLRQLPVEAGWKEPGPRTLQNVIDDARKNNVRVIFVQPQFSQKEAQRIAEAISGALVVIDPLAADFVDNLRRVADIFVRNMQ